MLGLDAAGKTTILYKLHIGEILSTVPTIGEQRSLQTKVHHSARHVSTVLSFDFYTWKVARRGVVSGKLPHRKDVALKKSQ
jgi:hypothetical protein